MVSAIPMLSVRQELYIWVDRSEGRVWKWERLDFTKLYADLQKDSRLVMSLIIIRDRDIAKKVCIALQH
jgi:hypothetical protein